MTDAITNVFKNTFAPLTRSQAVATGFTIDVVLEAAISYGIRMLIGVKRPFWELITEIALAGPLMSVGAFYEVKLKDKQGKDIIENNSVRFMLGLQTVPALFMAQYVLGTIQKGFYTPKFGVWPILITIVARSMSRVIIMYMADKKFAGMESWAAYFNFQSEQLARGRFRKETEEERRERERLARR